MHYTPDKEQTLKRSVQEPRVLFSPNSPRVSFSRRLLHTDGIMPELSNEGVVALITEMICMVVSASQSFADSHTRHNTRLGILGNI